MDKPKHPIDDLFREALKDLREEPSAAGREAFLKEAEQALRKRETRKWWLIIPLLFLILAGTGTAMYLLFPSSDTEQSATVTGPPPSATVAAAQPAPTSETKIHNEITSEGIQTVEQKQTNRISEQNIPQNITTSILPAVKTSEEMKKEPVIAEPVLSVTPEATSIPVKDTNKPAVPIAATDPIPDTLPKPDTLSDAKKKKSPLQKKEMSINLGVNYIPEWMFNTLEGDKYVNNFGLEGIFRIERYSIRTGVGLSITKGTNELAIGYNEYLGSYQDLDSIEFTWDEKHYHLLPTYYTSEKDVWDSLVKIEENKVIKRYTYLQIPLVLGYDFLQKGRFSMGVRTGPILSLLLTSKQLSANYDPGRDQIVAINEITPDRIQTNWQVMAGINFSILLNKRWTIEVEPEGRYYFNSVYEKSDITKKPWSIGLRAAILFDLKK
jgi:hypothetical protein